LTPVVPPPATRRLFAEYPLDALDLSSAAPFVIGRLLEDGDGADLAWLFGSLPEAEAAAWVARRGGRQLSRRSGAFWRLVIGPAASTPEPAESAALWPL